jgi:hypothetical protein
MTKDRTVDALPSGSERPADAVLRLDTALTPANSRPEPIKD